MSYTVQTIETDDDPPETRTLLSVTAGEDPPDAGVFAAFLAASDPPVVVGDGGVSAGWLKDEEGNATGWKATIDADEAAVNAAMKQWEAPVDPAPALEATLATSLTGLIAGADANRTVEERLATLEAFCAAAAGLLRPDLAREAQQDATRADGAAAVAVGAAARERSD